MKLEEYVTLRGVKVAALTKPEADILGIPYPLQFGWIELYDEDIPHEQVVELLRAMQAKRKLNEEYAKKARKKHSKSKGKKVFSANKNNKVVGRAGNKTIVNDGELPWNE